MDYSTDKKMYKENSMGHNPNDGENQVHFSGNTEGGRSEKIMDSAGVEDGLASIAPCSPKNYESVTANQRPEGNTAKTGEFTIGVS
ncbi:MAG: hypothetical protein MJK15_00840 [Colwellia sp.]|nr:hypothetical protein [Colwellia sp.]